MARIRSALPVILVARSTLGTINHTLLSLDVLNRNGLEIIGVVMNGPKNRSNKDAIETYGKTRVKTIKAAKRAGMQVCAGGLFGIGETDEQVLELGLALRHLDVDAVPVNFLIPVAGTRLEKTPRISALRCLKIIALLRYLLVDKPIIICGGRTVNLGRLHDRVFEAEASGIMTGNYLTAPGCEPADDHAMIRRLGLIVK